MPKAFWRMKIPRYMCRVRSENYSFFLWRWLFSNSSTFIPAARFLNLPPTMRLLCKCLRIRRIGPIGPLESNDSHKLTTSPRMLILVGLPGSGKSSLAARLAGKGYDVVNQDNLGDRNLAVATKALRFCNHCCTWRFVFYAIIYNIYIVHLDNII